MTDRRRRPYFGYVVPGRLGLARVVAENIAAYRSNVPRIYTKVVRTGAGDGLPGYILEYVCLHRPTNFLLSSHRVPFVGTGLASSCRAPGSNLG